MGGQSSKKQMQEMEGHRQKASSGNYAQWQLKSPDVKLVDMVLYEELWEKNRARGDKQKKRKRDEAQGRADG